MHIRSTHPLALALAASGLLTACGGSDSPAGSQAPRMQLSISATEDFAGSYGSVGAYEKVTGVLRGELDPADPKNAVIQDLALAPVNARGMVEYSTDRKSTRLNSSHLVISYAVFCLKKKKKNEAMGLCLAN